MIVWEQISSSPHIDNYIISIAFTKKVIKKGSIKVNQGQCVKMAINKAAAEIKNSIQYIPFEFLFTSMLINFWQK